MGKKERKKKKEEKKNQKQGRTRKKKQWILHIIHKLQGHWHSVPVSYLHGYFKRKNKQATPQLPISILWLSEIWHRPRHSRHRELQRPPMANSWILQHAGCRLYQAKVSLVLSSFALMRYNLITENEEIWVFCFLVKGANEESLSNRDAQLQTHGASSAEYSSAIWAPFFPGFL